HPRGVRHHPGVSRDAARRQPRIGGHLRGHLRRPHFDPRAGHHRDRRLRSPRVLMQAAAPAPSGLGTLHARVTLLAGLAFGSNGITLGVISYALLGLKASWGLTPGQAGLLVMASGAGQLTGGILVGYLADWVGRRWGYGVTVALSSLATASAALAPSLPWLVLALFIAGIGFGGVAPVATSLVGEFAPHESRGALMGWTQVIWIAGWILAALGGLVCDDQRVQRPDHPAAGPAGGGRLPASGADVAVCLPGDGLPGDRGDAVDRPRRAETCHHRRAGDGGRRRRRGRDGAERS